MRNCPMDSIDEYDDIHTKDQYEIALKTGLNEEEALKVCYKKAEIIQELLCNGIIY